MSDRPYSDPSQPGRKDVDGVEWWACDPYPTWYRWEGTELYTDEPEWPKEGAPPCHSRRLTLDDVHESWGLGKVCLGCGLPVRVIVEHI